MRGFNSSVKKKNKQLAKRIGKTCCAFDIMPEVEGNQLKKWPRAALIHAKFAFWLSSGNDILWNVGISSKASIRLQRACGKVFPGPYNGIWSSPPLPTVAEYSGIIKLFFSHFLPPFLKGARSGTHNPSPSFVLIITLWGRSGWERTGPQAAPWLSGDLNLV